MTTLQSTLDHVDSNIDGSVERLFDLLKIESISTDPAYKPSCTEAAKWLASEQSSLGFDASVRETEGHPMVVGHHPGPDGAPHVLFYGHYDVQPVDPIELWDTPPFEPSIADVDGSKHIRARGASDDKGQLMTFVEACRAWKETGDELPCAVSILFEGEEESGSPSLDAFLNENGEELKADITLYESVAMCGSSHGNAL